MIDKLDPLENARGYRLMNSKPDALFRALRKVPSGGEAGLAVRIHKKNIGSLVLRADSGPSIGTGHVARCLTLGEAWIERGGTARLIGRGFSATVRQRAAKAGVKLSRVRLQASITRGLRQAIEDASWVVLDGYHFPARLRAEIRRAASRMLLIEDRAQVGTPTADLLLDTNLGARRADYPGQPDTTRFLLGPSYALIRKEFLRASKGRSRLGNGRRLLVTMGGAPSPEVLRFALDVAASLHKIDHISVVVGSSRAPRSAQAHPRSWRMLKNVQNMARVMAKHDLALAAPGTTSWELCRMGLPGVMVAVAENQFQIGSALANAGIYEYLGPLRSVKPEVAARSLDALAADHVTKERMRTAGQRLVDGKGASRVVDAMVERLP